MKPTLVVMAAGMGSRCGGLKQIEPVGPSGEIMLDYSVFDAIRAGFGRVVFVIRHDIEKDFKRAIGSHFVKRIPVAYAYQERTDLPAGFSVPPDRTKPWGTAHAVLCCRNTVKEPFAVINADDFYGAESYQAIVRYLQILAPQSHAYAMVGFQLVNTLSDHGSVSRGICDVDADQMLKSVVERFKIEKTENGVRYEDGQGRRAAFRGNKIASMNMFGFTPTLFGFLAEKFPAFLKKQAGRPGAEFMMPAVVDELIQERKSTMRVLATPEKWFGITYKEDKPFVVAGIHRLIETGVYPEKLWDEKS